MEYNTSRASLIFPEYGRAIQEMVNYAKELPTKEERSAAAKTIVNAMAVLHPQQKDMTDYRQKLWDHLFIIADFNLDCEAPYPMPDPEIVSKKPKPIAYPQKNIRMRHYGSIVEKMVAEAKNMEEGAERESVIEQIANFMKMSYLTWNRDTVSDELIFDQLKEFSGGLLSVKEDTKLATKFIDLQDTSRNRHQHNNNNNKNHRSGKKRNGFNRGK
jgi:hypothetical protein